MPGFSLAAVIVAGVTSTVSAQQARQARKQQRKAAKIQQRVEEVKQKRERVRQIQEQRILQARVQSQAIATGTATSSTTAGVQSSLQSQLGANLSFLDQTAQANRRTSRLLQSAADFQTNVGTIKAAGSSFSQLQGTGIFN